MPNVIDLDLVRQGDAHLKRAKHLNPDVTARPVEVAQIVTTQRQTFTVSELARLVGVHPQTVRRAIDAGQLKAAQSGEKGHHRISYAEAEAWWRGRGGGVLWEGDPNAQAQHQNGATPTHSAGSDTPEAEAAAILKGLHSDDGPTRNAAIVALSHADEETSQIVEEAAARAVEEWQGEEDDLSDWRALDSEPFHFPEEPSDYLTGLYRSDAKAEEAAT